MGKIEAFLKSQDRIINEDKEKTLIELGLTEKEYAPDGKKSYQYSNYDYDYASGEKRYYRYVAMKVTDEEYALIVEKAKRVAEIEKKKELAREKEIRKIPSNRIVKKWVPVFKKADNEYSYSEEKCVETGKSRISLMLRVVAWILACVLFISGTAIALGLRNMLPFWIAIIAAFFELLMFYPLAAILDYLAELTAIARNGYKNEGT